MLEPVGFSLPPSFSFGVEEDWVNVWYLPAYRVIVDAGYEDSPFIYLPKIGPIQGVLLTHHHPDHSGGVKVLKEKFPFLKVVSPWDGKERWLDEFSCFGIPTPGHTTPHLSYFFPKERFLFSGDLVLGRGTPWVGPPEGDVELFLQSCERVLEYKPFTLYPGHGPVGSEKQVEETIRHKLFRIEEVYKVLTSPKTIQEIVEEIYIEKEGLFLEGMRRIVAEMSVEGYLTYLIRKGRVIRMGERYGRKGVFP